MIERKNSDELELPLDFAAGGGGGEPPNGPPPFNETKERKINTFTCPHCGERQVSHVLLNWRSDKCSFDPFGKKNYNCGAPECQRKSSEAIFAGEHWVNYDLKTILNNPEFEKWRLRKIIFQIINFARKKKKSDQLNFEDLQ